MQPRDVQLEQARADQERARSAVEASPRRRKGVALCLSGGGYRAALFHLGALLRLHETGWLPQVRLFSSVSGGRMVSAWLATRYLAGRSGPDENFGNWCARIDFAAEVPREFEVLVNHGYFMCGHGLDSRPGTRPPGGVGEGRWPYPRMANPDRGREALRDSHARLLHTRWLRGR